MKKYLIVQNKKKQENCGVFSCLFAEHLILSNNLDEIELDDTDPRGEMTNDLLALATPAYLPLPKNLQSFISNDLHTSIPTEDQKVALDQEVASAGLTYRQPPTPKDGNCLFHAMSDQLTRVGRLPQTPSKLRSDLVRYLKSNSTTPDGVHFREFINHGGWDTYLRRMSRDGEWGDWIALWGLVNMLNLPVALVSSLGEGGLQIINPATNGDEGGDITVMALLGHEAEVHYHSLEALQDPVTEMKVKYGEGKVTEEICPKCGKKFAYYSQGVFEGLNGMLQVYSDDSFFCDNCQMLEDFDYMQ